MVFSVSDKTNAEEMRFPKMFRKSFFAALKISVQSLRLRVPSVNRLYLDYTKIEKKARRLVVKNITLRFVVVNIDNMTIQRE